MGRVSQYLHAIFQAAFLIKEARFALRSSDSIIRLNIGYAMDP